MEIQVSTSSPKFMGHHGLAQAEVGKTSYANRVLKLYSLYCRAQQSLRRVRGNFPWFLRGCLVLVIPKGSKVTRNSRAKYIPRLPTRCLSSSSLLQLNQIP